MLNIDVCPPSYIPTTLKEKIDWKSFTFKYKVECKPPTTHNLVAIKLPIIEIVIDGHPYEYIPQAGVAFSLLVMAVLTLKLIRGK